VRPCYRVVGTRAMTSNEERTVNSGLVPEIDRQRCDLCADCVAGCPSGALSLDEAGLHLDLDRCAYCGDCEDLCPKGAIRVPFEVVLPRP